MARLSQVALVALAVALVPLTVSAARDDCPADPYADPSTDTCNPLRYVPNEAVNIVAAVLYFLTAAALTYRQIRQPANFFLCLVIGAWCEGIGLAIRLGLRNNLHSTGLYIAMYLFVVLSPCAFLAGNYILLGRLVAHLEGDRYLRPFKPRLVSWIFIISDVITFFIQAAGGGLSISDNVKTAQAGGNIFLAGIAAQMASFILFSSLWAVFAFRIHRGDRALWDLRWWRPLHYAMGFTCICFVIRSVYRTVELSQGYIGFLATHERYFLGLDTLPLWLGINTYVFFWPGAYLTPEHKVQKVETTEVGMEEAGNAGGSEMAVADPETRSSSKEGEELGAPIRL
ncbi:RTA1 like protein-domain-containing protein [Naematelia encephala]|uniref:RTA1 like protein-domain-containing protein n=1 Tax=Naematelia encephala TaxID=71784 RepID=A0A1Y2BFW0_9TREE|nr:RTA1 like protein-domain-containing protein [Naematelia encephala]